VDTFANHNINYRIATKSQTFSLDIVAQRNGKYGVFIHELCSDSLDWQQRKQQHLRHFFVISQQESYTAANHI